MFLTRYIQHPVMGTFAIVLALTIAGTPLVYLWQGVVVAEMFSLAGTFLACLFATVCVLLDVLGCINLRQRRR